MIVNISLADDALRRIVQMRLLAEFRPIDEPVTFAGQPCYIDRFEVSGVAFANADRVVNFAVNNVNAAQEVVPVGPAIGVRPVTVTVTGRVYLTSVASVQAAGAAQADGRYGLPDLPFELSVPILGAVFDLSMAVSPAGVATLGLALQSLPGAELLADAGAFLAGFQSLTLPFAVGSAFADVLAPGATRVLNAGVTHLDDGTVIRLEYEPEPVAPADTARRHNGWLRFFGGQVPSQLAGRAWAIDLPTQEMVRKAAREVDGQFEGKEARKFFTSTGDAWGEFVPGWPGFRFEKEGVLESVCGGLDVRATVETTVSLSVPAPNTLRTSGEIELDLNDWDSFKCFLVALLNPFAGLITTFDKGAPWWAFLPISVALPLAPIAWGFGADDLVVREVIKKAQEKAAKKGQAIVRTSLSTFYSDADKAVVTDLTRDWLIVQEVRGSGDRLVLAGDFVGPDIKTLPRLRGRLDEPFPFWTRGRCSTGEYVTTATITLGLDDVPAGWTVTRPPVPVRYGIDVETVDGQPQPVGQATWRIVDDAAGYYTGPKTRVNWVAGVPGAFEVTLGRPPDAFASAPYGLRMQFFTSLGVREFRLPVPPAYPKPPATREEVIAEAAERISECYAKSSLIGRVKALQVHWLPTPQPDLKVGQHWQALVRGLSVEDRLVAWDADTRTVLAEVRSYNGGVTEVSLVQPPGQPLRALQLTLNDAPFLDEETYRRRVAELERREADGPTPVVLRQTPLYLVAQVELDESAESLSARRVGGALRLTAGGLQYDFDPLDPSARPRRSWTDEADRELPQVPSRLYTLARSQRGRERVVEIVGPGIPGEGQAVARYFARPWYDRGAVAGRFFAQLDDAGAHIDVYRLGTTRDAEPELGGPRG